ncbi:polysaccharide biosynthesis/export family protein [Limnohabitans sp. G3-2]|uniref:polysaccharide biosynthesis/export family protein n=1 Tax=Limnohabitans sp. G3-2 TaxID=1100711 RepID=UPI001E42A713|nr:polysaccharide biosynthesis/export family protein [Limnohabitans sp. G3-2]
MPQHLQSAPRHTLFALAMLACLSCSLPAAAQFQAGTVPQAGMTQPSAIPATDPAAALPAAGVNTAVKPALPVRPDLGAADADRLLSQARPRKAQAPSQFQRFVQESTGRLLPHFGADLFDNPQAYATDAAAPAPAEYVLGQGDEVRIQIWGAVDYAGTHTLDRNGQISLPKIGTLNLAGVQVKDLEAALRKHVATVFNNVTLTASLGKLRGITVYVVGQAQQPGTYNLNSLSTLINAVFASGGPGVNGSMRGIQLKRAGKTVTTLDLYDFIAQGDKSKDARLQPGDVIMIPPAGPRMALTGATDHGAIYEVKPGQTVQDILALGGGVPALASAQKALVERIDPAQAAAPRQVQNLVLNAQGLAQPLQDGDVLTLLPISPAFGNAVTLQGTVAQPLRNAWFPGMRVQDLIPDREALITPEYYRRKNQLVQNRSVTLKAQGLTPAQIQAIEKAQQLPENLALATEIITGTAEAGAQSRAGSNVSERVRGMVDQINWDYALIERLNKAELRTELIPFNLGKAVVQKDPAHNLLLQSGDVITIMSSNDLQLPSDRKTRLVRVEGEVAAPGVYQARPGETLPQLLLRAGGVMPQAYLYGLEFTRESVRKQQQENLDQVIRRLENQAQSAAASLAANLTGERAAQAQILQQQQQQQQQSQIARLKALKSKGRVALELDPAAGESAKPIHLRSARGKAADFEQLPDLPLEDGDAILVPSLPMFVSAVGSVSNENVMIYKTGKTVGEVIKSASPTDEADPSEAFLLRADGSVFSRRAAGFFNSFESTKVMPGDTLIVPARVDRESGYNFLVRALRDWTQIFSNLGIGAAAIKTLKN